MFLFMGVSEQFTGLLGIFTREKQQITQLVHFQIRGHWAYSKALPEQLAPASDAAVGREEP